MNTIEGVMDVSCTQLLAESADTAADHMFNAVKHIDAIFAVGYAAANPQLIADFMKVAQQDFTSAIEAQVALITNKKLAEEIHFLALTMENTNA